MARGLGRTQLGLVSLNKFAPVSAGIGVVAGYGVATGGSSSSITVSSVNYTLLTFTADDTLTVATAGLFDVCLVAGGGAGGKAIINFGTSGGGGGGGIVFQTIYLSANASVSLGAGGTSGGVTWRSASGKETSIYTADNYEVTAIGGGCGMSMGGGTTSIYFPCGGSGGGSSSSQTSVGSSLRGQGSDGGQGGISGAYAGGGGGGGGASAVGANGVTTTGGNGGAGLDISVWLGQAGGTTIKGGGGGGGGAAVGTAGTGNGSANTGGGGVGRNFDPGSDGAVGYSGIAYVRFKV